MNEIIISISILIIFLFCMAYISQISEEKIKAIKVYREHTGLGLKESKEHIDNLEMK